MATGAIINNRGGIITMNVIAYHHAYINRLANIYMDMYDEGGYQHAVEWHQRTTGDDVKLKELLKLEIKRIAPERGLLMRDD